MVIKKQTLAGTSWNGYKYDSPGQNRGGEMSDDKRIIKKRFLREDWQSQITRSESHERSNPFLSGGPWPASRPPPPPPTVVPPGPLTESAFPATNTASHFTPPPRLPRSFLLLVFHTCKLNWSIVLNTHANTHTHRHAHAYTRT